MISTLQINPCNSSHKVKEERLCEHKENTTKKSENLNSFQLWIESKISLLLLLTETSKNISALHCIYPEQTHQLNAIRKHVGRIYTLGCRVALLIYQARWNFKMRC